MPITVRKKKETLGVTTTAASVATTSSGIGGTITANKNLGAVERTRPVRGQGRGAVMRRGNRQGRKKIDSNSSSSSSTSSSSSSNSSSSNSSSSNSSSDDDDDDKKKKGDETVASPRAGRMKNLAGFWSAQVDGKSAAATTTTTTTRKKRFEVIDAPGTLVLENEPERLEGVVRADDPGEWEKPIEIEKGRARSIASMLQAKKDEAPKVARKPIRLDVERGDPMVLENQPVVLEGVVRSGEPQQTDEDIFKQQGRIRNIAERWKRAQQQQPNSDDDEDDDEDISKRPKSPKKPAWLVELELAKESGVYETENTPVVRDDVIRADDDEPDVISFQRTRNLRKMWTEIEQDRIQEDRERETHTKTSNKTHARQQQITSSSSESGSETESEEEEEDSSEKEDEEDDVDRVGGPERPTVDDPSPDSSSNIKYTLYVNEASLRYAPKK